MSKCQSDAVILLQRVGHRCLELCHQGDELELDPGVEELLEELAELLEESSDSPP